MGNILWGHVDGAEHNSPRTKNTTQRNLPLELDSALLRLESIVEEGDFSAWQLASASIQKDIINHFDLAFEHITPFRLLLPPWSYQLKETVGLEGQVADSELIAWELTRAHFFHLQHSRVQLNSDEALQRIAPLELLGNAWWEGSYWWVATFLFWILIGVTAWHSKRRNGLKYKLTHHLSKGLLFPLAEHHDNDKMKLLVAKLEYDLGASVLTSGNNNSSDWVRLTPIQQLICHLTVRGISGIRIAEHFGFSKGHYYNERSIIRKKLQVASDENLKDFLMNMVTPSNKG